MDSLQELKKFYPKSYFLLLKYLNLDFGKNKINTPYWINNIKKGIRGPFSGKGLPGQIVRAAKDRAKKQNKVLSRLNEHEVLEFLKQNRIGVDCSGFAYNLLNRMDKEKGGNGIADDIFAQKVFNNWNPAWRAGANILTGNKVSKSVALEDVALGDMIRLDNGRHVAVIVGKTNDKITYAHSSRALSRKKGVHLGTIHITDAKKGLLEQRWDERSANGRSLAKNFLNVKNGDGLKRFKWWK